MSAGHTYTETPDGHTAADFFGHVRAGRVEIAGRGGSALILSHGLYQTAYAFAQDRFVKKAKDGKSRGETPALLEKMFARFMEGQNPTEFTFSEKLGFLAQGILSGKDLRDGASGEHVALERVEPLLFPTRRQGRHRTPDRRGGRARTARIPHRQSFHQPTRVPVFQQVRHAALRRQHDGRTPGAERHRAHRVDAQSVHLCFQEPGAGPSFPARLEPRDRRRSCRPRCATPNARGSPTRWKM